MADDEKIILPWPDYADKKELESYSREELERRIQEAQARMRAAKGLLDMEDSGVFSGRDCFRRTLDLSKNPGRAHSLHSHFVSGTAAYEVVRRLEAASNRFPRADRFLFMSLGKLRRTCYSKDKVQLSERAFFNALSLLRLLGGISPRLERENREGYVIPPHDAVCALSADGRSCTWVGPSLVPRKGMVGRFAMTMEGWTWQP